LLLSVEHGHNRELCILTATHAESGRKGKHKNETRKMKREKSYFATRFFCPFESFRFIFILSRPSCSGNERTIFIDLAGRVTLEKVASDIK